MPFYTPVKIQTEPNFHTLSVLLKKLKSKQRRSKRNISIFQGYNQGYGGYNQGYGGYNQIGYGGETSTDLLYKSLGNKLNAFMLFD